MHGLIAALLLREPCCMAASYQHPSPSSSSLPINCRQMKRSLCVVSSLNGPRRGKTPFALLCKGWQWCLHHKEWQWCSVPWFKSLSTMNCPAEVRRRKMVLLPPPAPPQYTPYHSVGWESHGSEECGTGRGHVMSTWWPLGGQTVLIPHRAG